MGGSEEIIFSAVGITGEGAAPLPLGFAYCLGVITGEGGADWEEVSSGCMPFSLPLGGFCGPFANSLGFNVAGDAGEQWEDAVEYGRSTHVEPG